MATKWQTIYTEAQYKQAVMAAFGLGRNDPIPAPAVRVAGNKYRDVRLRRRTSGDKRRTVTHFRVQIRRAFLLRNAPVRWIDIMETTSEDCAGAFLEDLAVAMASHEKRVEIESFKCNEFGAGTKRKPAPRKKAKGRR